MKRIIYLIIFLALSQILICNIDVNYRQKQIKESINVVSFEGVEYFNVFELNKVFKAYIFEDIIENRLNVNLYQKQIIILLNSNYLTFHQKTYNMGNPVICRDSKYYLPASFLKDILPQVCSSNVKFEENEIMADFPVDNSIKKIVIDPGHGGRDPGAIGYSDIYEKTIVLKVANKLERFLKSKNIEVVLTRTRDEFMSLRDRTKFANNEKADLFISLHCNSSRSSRASGVEVFFLSPAKTDEARVVEAIENSVVYDYEGGEEAMKNYDDLSYILMDMAQSEHIEESSDLAIKLQANLVKVTSWKDRGVKQAGFFVLKGAFMPAVLVEMGFISNKKQESYLKKEEYQDKLAKAIFNGIIDFKNKYDFMQ